jgi:hypothetical protein
MEKPLRNVTDCHGCSPQRARSTDAVEDAPRRAGLADRNVCPAEQHSRNQSWADGGVGRGPGGPPHKSSQAAKKLMDSSTNRRRLRRFSGLVVHSTRKNLGRSGAGAFACEPIFNSFSRSRFGYCGGQKCQPFVHALVGF